MRVPLSWLAEYVELPQNATPDDVMAQLVKVGLEEEGSHGGEGIFHQAHFALGIGLRDEFGDDAAEQFFGTHKIPDFHVFTS